MKNLKFLAKVLLFIPLFFSSCEEDSVNVDVTIKGKNLRKWEVAAPLAQVNIEMKRWLDSLFVDKAFIGKGIIVNTYSSDDLKEVLFIEYRDTIILNWGDTLNNRQNSNPPIAFDAPIEKEDNDFKFSIFDELQLSEGFRFADIQLNAKVINSIQVPFDFTIKDVKMYKDNSDIEHELKLNSGDIKMSITAGPGGEGKIDEVNTYNSNIADMELGKNSPNKLKFNIVGNAKLNSASVNTQGTDMKVALSLKFPAFFWAKPYERRDTIDFEVDKLFNEDIAKSIDYVELCLKMRNGLPFDVIVDAYVTDSTGTTIGHIDILDEKDKPINDKFLISETPDSKGKIDVDNAKEELRVIKISGTDLMKYREKDVKHLIFHTTSRTFEVDKQGKPDYVKVFEKSGMKIFISMEAKFKVPDDHDNL